MDNPNDERAAPTRPEAEARFISGRDRLRQRKALIILILAALAIIIALIIFNSGSDSASEGQQQFSQLTDNPGSSAPRPEPGQPAPEISIAAVDRPDPVTLPLSGQPQVLEFIATWCKYCQKMSPILSAEINKRAPEVKLVVIGAADEGPEALQDFAQKSTNKQLGQAPLLIDDRQKTLTERYQLAGYPTMVFINRQGKITATIVGLQERKTITAALAEISTD